MAPPFTLTDADGEFVASVTWRAPALNTVLLRFSEEEVRQILIYGRPGTPMPAWGVAGGGPLTTQQIDELIAYLGSIQITVRGGPGPGRGRPPQGARPRAPAHPIDYTDPAVGEALFNLGLGDVRRSAAGAFSCARCHTKGASIVHGPEEPAGRRPQRRSPASPTAPAPSGFSLALPGRAAPVPDHRGPRRVPHKGTEPTCSTASGARARAACPASATTRTPRDDAERRHVHARRCSRPSPSTRPTSTSTATATRLPRRPARPSPSPTPTPPRPPRSAATSTTTEEP